MLWLLLGVSIILSEDTSFIFKSFEIMNYSSKHWTGLHLDFRFQALHNFSSGGCFMQPGVQCKFRWFKWHLTTSYLQTKQVNSSIVFTLTLLDIQIPLNLKKSSLYTPLPFKPFKTWLPTYYWSTTLKIGPFLEYIPQAPWTRLVLS